MKYTDNDFKLYKELMKASKDGICYRLPTTITKRDVERLCDLGMCDRSNPNLLYLLYTDYELADLENSLHDQLEYEKQQAAAKDAERAEERAYLDQQRKKQFRHDWGIAIFNLTVGTALGAILDHFFDIVGYAADLWRSLFP